MNWHSFKKHVLLSSSLTYLSLGSLHGAACSTISTLGDYTSGISGLNAGSCEPPLTFDNSSTLGIEVITGSATTISSLGATLTGTVNFTTTDTSTGAPTVTLSADASTTQVLGILGTSGSSEAGITINVPSQIVLSSGTCSVLGGTLGFSTNGSWTGLDGITVGTASGTSSGTAGTLHFSDTSTQGSFNFPVTLSGDATLNIDANVTVHANSSAVISGTGTFTVSGSTDGVFSSDATNTYTGPTVVTGTEFYTNALNSISSSSSVQLTNGGSLNALNTKNGSIINNLSGDSTSGLQVGNSDLPFSTGYYVNQTTTTTFAGIISGRGFFSKQGTGTLVLSGINTYTRGTTISAGTLSLSGSGSIAESDSVTISSSGTLEIINTTSGATINDLIGSGTISLGTQNLTINEITSTTFSGSIGASGVSGGIIKQGTGTLTLTGAAGSNNYSGNTVINIGTLQAGATNTLSPTSVVSFANTSGVTLDLNDFSNKVAGLSDGGASGGNVTLGTATLTIDVSSSLSYAGSIGGAGNLITQGTGTQTLTGTNLFTGTTAISGSSTLSLSGSGSIAESSSVAIASAGTLEIVNTTSGATVNNLSGSGTVSLGTQNLTIDETTSTTFSGSIGTSGVSGGIIKKGTETLTLSGAEGSNNYSGNTVVNVGTLQAGATNTLSPTSVVSLANTSGVTLDLNDFSNEVAGLSDGGASGGNVTLGTATLTIDVSSSLSYAGSIGGTGNLITQGTGTQTLTGTNLFTGTTSVSGTAALSLSGTGSIADSISVTVNSGTAFKIENTTSGASINTLYGSGSVTLGTQILTITELVASTFSGGITGDTGGIIKQGTETLTLSGTAGLNLYSGDSLVNVGTLKAGAVDTLSPESVFSFTNASGVLLDINDLNNTIAGLSGGGTTGGNVSLGSSSSTVLTMDTNTDESFAGIVYGTGSIIITGSGTQTFTGTNIYTGTTTINNSTLFLTGSGSIKTSSAVTINSPGVLSTQFGTQDTTIRNVSGDGSIVIGNNTLIIAENSNTEFSGIISNATGDVGGITKVGSSTFTLSGVNTLTGPVSIAEGALNLKTAGSIETASLVSITDSASLNIALVTTGATVQTLTSDSTSGVTLGSKTLTIVPTENSTFHGTISGIGAIQITGPNVITFTGTNTFTGPSTITQGTLSLSGTGSVATSSAVTVTSPGELDISNTTAGATVQALAGSGSVTLGTQTLTVNETSSSTFSGSITGLGAVALTGPGGTTLTVSGSNLYTGSTTISVGTLALSGTGSIASSSSVAITSGATLSISATTSGATIQTISGAGAVTLGDQALTITQESDQTLSGAITGTGGSILKEGDATLTISGTSNTYTGTTAIVAGTLKAGATDALSPSSAVTFTNTTDALLQLNDFNNEVANISGGGTSGGWINLGSATLTVGGANTNVTFSGIIYDGVKNGSLTKTGTGALGLGGLNTYSGTTTVNSGSLKAEITNAFSHNSSVVLANTLNAVLDLNDFNNKISNVTGGGTTGGWIDLGSGILTTGSASVDATYDGKIYGTGGIIKAGSATFTLTNPNTYTGPTVVEQGTLALTLLGTISDSSSVEVADGATFSISGITPATSASINTLRGAGTLSMGSINLTINQNSDGGFSGVINGSGDLTVEGSMTLGISGVQTYTGTTTISESATIALSGLGDISSSSALTIGSSATLNTELTTGTSINNISGSGSIILGLGILTLNQSSALTYSGTITEVTEIGGNLKKAGSATLTLSGSADYSGTTNIAAGSIETGAANALSSNSIVTFEDVASAGLNLAGFHNTVAGLSGGGSTGGDVTLGSAILTINAEEDVTFSAIITGTGGIAKTGTATQTFAGVSTYSSSTTISKGTLALQGNGSIAASSQVTVASAASFDISGVTSGAVIGRLSGAGTVSIGTKILTVNQTGIDTTFSGDIEGSGPFIKAGSKTLTLSGTISHTGSTVVTAGTLKLLQASSISASKSATVTAGTLDISTAGATLNTLTGTGGVVELGGQTLTAISLDNSTYSGSIRGTGGNLVVQAGNFNFQLGGESTFTGTATIETGVLSIRDSGSIETAESLTISSGTSLHIRDTTSGTSISTPIGSGSIELGSKTLTIVQKAASTFSGTIKGTGSLIKQKSNTLTLDGTSTFTGGVSLEKGQITLASDKGLGSGGALSMTNATILDLNNEIEAANPIVLGVGTGIVNVSTGIASLTGGISGTGGLNKTGAGTLVIDGVGTFTGNTTVTDGILTINNSFASNITVNAGTVLGGNVETTGNIAVEGTLKPGNSAGDIKGADITLNPGSSVIISLESTDHSTIEATGTLTIDPSTTVTFFAEPGYDQFNQKVAFATAETIIGEFAKSETNAPILESTLSYSSNTVDVTLSIVDLDNVLPPGNALSTWHAIVTVLESTNNSLNPILATLYPLGLDEVEVALNQMQPAQLKGLTISQENNMIKVQDTLSLRLEEKLNIARCTMHKSTQKGDEPKESCDREETAFQAWADGFGDTLHQGSNYTAASPQTGYQIETGGIVAGFDYHFAHYFYAGALGGYTSSDISWANGQGSGDIQSGYAGLYFAAMNDRFFATTSAIGSWNSYSAKRNILYPGVSKTAKNDHGGSQFFFNFDVGANLGYGDVTIRPFNSFDYITQSESSFTETGAGAFNLYVDNVNAIMLRNELGIQFASCLCFKTSRWTISPKFSWVREIRIKGENTMTQFASTTVPFKVTGYFPNRNLFSPGISVTSYWLEDTLALELYYNGEYGQKYSDSSYGGQIRFGF